jgi:predicted ATPase/DNA-binding winged helix-turn-helix (wHTH) protein
MAQFGRFRLDLHRRELLADGVPILIGGRAFDILTALIEVGGELVTKDELMSRVWPGRIVEEQNLHFQVWALRKVLGPDRGFIKTISGRGYRFVGKITTPVGREETGSGPASASAVECGDSASPTNLPRPTSDLVGREAQLSQVADLVAAHRLVTLVGEGGIGKTRLGLELARRSLPRFADGVWLAELGPLSDPELVLPTIARVLGLADAGPAAPEPIAATIASKRLLLVLDNCEHVIDAVASIAEAFLHAGGPLQIIATSREPLRIDGEHVYRVPSLDAPAEGVMDGEDLLRYGSVRLFVERAHEADANFSPSRPAAAAIGAVCRRLDGIPLAIELAAARAATLGVEELAARLGDRFGLLTSGRRTALPRQRTLRATLDWSYDLLTEPERVVLRRLAIFAGGFTLQAVSAVAAGDEIAAAEVVDCVDNLVTKSLVSADAGGAKLRYRLLETTRAYSLEKLVQAGEFDAAARRHARRHLDLFEGAEAEAETRPADEWLADYGPRIDNLRAALDWAFSPGGDASIGVALTASAVPLWMHLSLMEECRGRVERALAAIGAGAGRDARREMQLLAALGTSLAYTRGGVPEIRAAWTKALEIAVSLGNVEYQLRTLWGLWSSHHISGGHHGVALTLAQRFHALAATRSELNDRLIGKRMIGTSQHYVGDLHNARSHLERVLAYYFPPAQRSEMVRFQTDQRVTARVYLARVLWLQGLPDQAMRTAESSVADAQATNHAMSLGIALALAACPIALFRGDLAAVEHYVEMLLDASTTHALALFRAWSRCHQAVLVIRRGDLVTGLQLLRAGLDELGEARSALRFLAFLSEMAEALGRAGQIADGLATIEEAMERSERTEERWVTAELLRIKGELLLLQGAPGAAAAAEDHFQQALDWARRQGALSWELRAATSLARLLRDRARSEEAYELLAAVYDRFTEGFATADLKAAKALIDDLS